MKGQNERRALGALSTLAVLLVAIGCGQTQSAGQGKPIIIGVVNDSSGPSSPFSTIAIKAIEVAVNEINNHGGVINNRPFQLIQESDSGQPSQAPTVVQHLIQQGAAAIIMNSGSASTLQVKSLLSESKVVGLAPLNGNPNIPLPPNNDYAFLASAPQNVLDIVTIAAMQKAGVKKPAFVIDDSATIAGLLPGTTKDFTDAGLPFVDIEKVPANATDASAQVARLVSKGADAMFLITNGGAINSVILNSLYDVAPKMWKFSGQTLCGDPANKLAKPEALDGTICSGQVTLDNPRTKVADSILKAKLGSSYPGIGTYYAQGYQTPYTLMKAFQLSGTDNAAALKDGMEKISKLPAYYGGPSFTLTYTPTKHNGFDGNCAYAINIYKGNTLGPLWTTYQPVCQ